MVTLRIITGLMGVTLGVILIWIYDGMIALLNKMNDWLEEIKWTLPKP